MTREDFINWFEERFVLTKNDIYEFGQLYNEVTKSQWISVEEEMPPIGGIVLVAIPLGGELSVLPLSIKNESDFKYLSGMTHWMPLPSIEHLKEKEL